MLADITAERAILASICRYGEEVYHDVSDLISAETFTNETNTMVYSCMVHLFKDDNFKKVDLPSILMASKELGINEFINRKEQINHLSGIFKFPAEKDNIRLFAAKIKKLEVARQMQNQLRETQNKYAEVTGSEPLSKILGIAEESLFDFMYNLFDHEDEPVKLFEKSDERIEFLAANPNDNIGIPTPFPLYNKAIGGGNRRGTVSVVGARSKVGKSFFGLNVGIHVAKNLNIPVLILDTEMRLEDTMTRGLANISEVSIDQIETGKFGKNANEKIDLEAAVQEHKDIPLFHMNIAGRSFEEQIGVMRRWITKHVGINPETGKTNDCYIIYDYLKLMDAEGMKAENLSEFQMLGFMMTGLHNFAIKYDLPILTFIQLNRDGITKESADTASGSDRIIWLCSNFVIYKFKSDEEKAEDGKDFGDRKLVPVLGRHGAGLEDGEYINIVFDGSRAKIKEHYTNLSKPSKNVEEEVFDAEADVPF